MATSANSGLAPIGRCPFGKYTGDKTAHLVVSRMDPRCHGECGSQKVDVDVGVDADACGRARPSPCPDPRVRVRRRFHTGRTLTTCDHFGGNDVSRCGPRAGAAVWTKIRWSAPPGCRSGRPGSLPMIKSTFPMTGHGAILGLGRTLGDIDHARNATPCLGGTGSVYGVCAERDRCAKHWCSSRRNSPRPCT